MTESDFNPAGQPHVLADLEDEFYNFQCPTFDRWQQAAMAGLSEGSNLDQLSRRTLDEIKIEVLYSSYPESMTEPPQPLDLAVAAKNRQEKNYCWDNRLTTQFDQPTEPINQKILRGLRGGNTSVELYLKDSIDLKTCLEDVALDIASIHFRCITQAMHLSRQFQEVCKSKGNDCTKIECSFNLDPVGYALKGMMNVDMMKDKLNSFSQDVHACLAEFPLAKTILVDITPHHNAGASVLQELQAAISTATLYLETLINQGMPLQSAHRQFVFQLACDADILTNTVKIRVLKQLWRHLLQSMAEQLNIEGDQFQMPGIVIETSQRYLSVLDPWNNHLRNIAACSVAAFNNTSSVIVHPHDQINGHCLSEDPIDGERIARNLPIILERESRLTSVQDPLAGSYAIEALTDNYCSKTWEVIANTGNSQDWLSRLEEGHWQQAIKTMHKKRVDLLRNDTCVSVGVNRFAGTYDDTQAVPPAHQTSSDNPIQLLPVRDASSFEEKLSASGKVSRGNSGALT